MLAAEARDHRRAAEIAEAIGLLHASELHGARRRELDDALMEMAEMESFSGRELGVPGVGEFFCIEAAAVLGINPGEALDMLLALQALKHRLPCVWEGFCEGEIWLWQARSIEAHTRKLSRTAALRVDAMIAVAVRTMPWSRVASKVEGYVKAADPELAREETLLQSERRRFSISKLEHGHAEVHGLLSARDAIDLDNAISHIASTLPAPELPVDATGGTLTGDRAAQFRSDVRRSMAAGELARASYGQDALPTHQLVVHIDANDPALDPDLGGTGVATVEDWGTLLTEDMPMLFEGSKVVVRPVLDIRKLPTTDTHDPSPLLRFAVQQRNSVDVFPYATLAARKCDLDHTIPYRDDGSPGQTHAGNLGPLSRRTHRAKTFGGFTLSQPEPGVFHWTTPRGWEFVVTDQGSIKVADPPPRRQPREEPVEWCGEPEEPPDEPPPIERRALRASQDFLFALTD